MPETVDPTTLVYQCRIWLRDLSPLIWRRLLIRGDTTLATLHTILQAAFAWEDDYLHAFHIYGQDYSAGANAASPATQQLRAFNFRRNERFQYTYNFYANWVHEIRIEAIGAVEAGQTYPWCCGGARAAPAEDCRDARTFLPLRQHYHILSVIDELVALAGAGPSAASKWDDDAAGACAEDDAGDGEDATGEQEPGDRVARCNELLYWLGVDCFDRRALNRHFRTLSGSPA